MTEHSSNTLDTDELKSARLFDWCAAIFFSFFPAIALLTYDWHAMESLQSPASPSSNWIGATGDYFAYFGYLSLGFAVWLIPFISIICIFKMPFAKRHVLGIKSLLLISLLITSVASMLQLCQNHIPGFSLPLERLNIPDAGGAVGYLIMTKALLPLLGEFGAGIIMAILFIISLVNLVGISRLVAGFRSLVAWVMNPGTKTTPDAKTDDNNIGDNTQKEQDSIWQTPESYPWANPPITSKSPEPTTSSSSFSDNIKSILAIKKAAKDEREAGSKPSSRLVIKDQPRGNPVQQTAAKTAKTAVATKDANDSKTLEPYKLPPISLLNPLQKSEANHGNIEETAKRLIDTLSLFNIKAKISKIITGPVVTKYAIFPEPGTRYESITSLLNNLKGAMQAKSLRIEAPIPGENLVGIEVPNLRPAGISFREIIESDTWKNADCALPLLLGKDVEGNNLVVDLAKMPHLIVAGATGQGKSVCLNSMICGLLMSRTPEELKLIMIDPKSVEFKNYERLPHLLAPVITDNKKTERALQMVVIEMEKRLKILSRANTRNIKQFNNRKSYTQTDLFGNDQEVSSDLPKKLPYIIIIIDELADIMETNGKSVTPYIARIAAKARAAGIHLILATQRPDTKTINGTIKSNIPGRIAFKTSSSIDSRTILDHAGAENLIGRGDMLYRKEQSELCRAQGALIGDDEIERLIEYIEAHSSMQLDEVFTNRLARVKDEDPEDQFKDEEDDSPKETAPNARDAVRAAEKASNYNKALEFIINEHRISASSLQVRLGIGFPNASSIIYKLQQNGVIGPERPGRPREILMSDDELRALFNATSGNDSTDSAADENAEQIDTTIQEEDPS